MSYPGFEILFRSVKDQFKNVDDASLAVIHWNLISNGFKCCGTGETWPSPDQTGTHVGSETLPADWNSDSTLYTLRYVESSSNRTYLMKALAIDGNLNVNFLRCSDEKAASITIQSRDYINSDYSSFERAYTNLAELNKTIKDDLVTKMLPKTPAQPTSSAARTPSSSSSQPQSQPERSPLMVDPPRNPSSGGVGFIPPRDPFRPAVDPFGYGRADLDPLSGGGGGMFMDPRGLPRPGFGPGGLGGPPGGFGGPPGFPPGSIPPGARFDPVGPPGMRPNPDPDHERPPDIDDMYM